jgi:hypothetical protein
MRYEALGVMGSGLATFGEQDDPGYRLQERQFCETIAKTREEKRDLDFIAPDRGVPERDVSADP